MPTYQHNESDSTNYKIILSNDYGTVERYCQEVSFPSISVAPARRKIGYLDLKLPSDFMEFDALRLKILLDRDILSYLEIFNLICLEVDQDTGVLNPSAVEFDAKLQIYNNNRIPIYEFTFEDSFITKLDGFVFSATTTEPITYGVEIVFNSMKGRSLVRTSL